MSALTLTIAWLKMRILVGRLILPALPSKNKRPASVPFNLKAAFNGFKAWVYEINYIV